MEVRLVTRFFDVAFFNSVFFTRLKNGYADVPYPAKHANDDKAPPSDSLSAVPMDGIGEIQGSETILELGSTMACLHLFLSSYFTFYFSFLGDDPRVAELMGNVVGANNAGAAAALGTSETVIMDEAGNIICGATIVNTENGEQAIVTEVGTRNMLARGQHGDDVVRAIRRCGRAVGGRCARRAQLFQGGLDKIENRDVVPGLDEVGGHGPAHVAEADERYFCHVLSPLA